jgi:hypothetical protein
MTTIISYAEDPGAANFIIPLHNELAAVGYNLFFLIDSFLLDYVSIKEASCVVVDPENIFEFVEKEKPDIILCGTSDNKNSLSFKLIEYAKKENIKTVAIVDMCVNLDKRLSGNTDEPLKYTPDYIAVCDLSTANHFEKLGFPRENIFVCGNPNLESLNKSKVKYSTEDIVKARKSIFKCSDEDIVFLFLTESIDQVNPEASYRDDEYTLSGRGDDDFRSVIVLQDVVDVVKEIDENIKIIVRLHPKDNVENYINIFDDVAGVDENKDPILSVLCADLVIGMTTMLLFEAYVLNKQTLSVLPRKEQAEWLPNTAGSFTPVASDKSGIKHYVSEFLSHGNINTENSLKANLLFNNSCEIFMNFLKKIEH